LRLLAVGVRRVRGSGGLVDRLLHVGLLGMHDSFSGGHGRGGSDGRGRGSKDDSGRGVGRLMAAFAPFTSTNLGIDASQDEDDDREDQGGNVHPGTSLHEGV